MMGRPLRSTRCSSASALRSSVVGPERML
jgi:hypothetical protein